jgi:hypothetical protein
MDYNSIIENTKKYHYFIKSSVRIIHLSESNNKSEAKVEALKKLEPTIDNIIGKKIIFLKIKSTNNKDNFFKSEDGPISLIFESAIIKSNNKIKDLIEGGNNTIYLSDKFIKKYKDNLLKNYKKIISNFYNEKLNKSLLDVTIL